MVSTSYQVVSFSVGEVAIKVVVEEFRLRRGRSEQRTQGLGVLDTLGELVDGDLKVGDVFLGYVQGNLLDVTIKVVNLVVAPLFVLFFMAIFSPVSSDRGAVAGGLAALVAAIGVSFFGLFGFVQTWNLFVALVVGIPVGIAVSFLDKNRMIQRNRDL